MDTIEELESYLEKNCYSFFELSIRKHYAPEGIIIETNNGNFNFSYSERGNKSVIKSFEKEQQLVEYALASLKQDEWVNAHIVANTFKLEEILETERELNDLNIHFNLIKEVSHFHANWHKWWVGTYLCQVEYKPHLTSCKAAMRCRASSKADCEYPF